MSENLNIPITATDEASAVLKRVEDNIESAGASAVQTGAAMGASFALADQVITKLLNSAAGMARAFAENLTQLLDYAEGLDKANVSTGISVEYMQKLVKEGDEMGTSFSQIRRAIEQFEKNIEGSGKALAAFGIDVKAFRDLSPDEALRKMAEQLMAIEDPMVRDAVAMAAFGKSGAELLPLLKKIADGSVDMQRALGKDTIAALNQTDQALDSLKTAWKGLVQQLTATVAINTPITATFNMIAEGLKHVGEWAVGVAAQYVGAMQTMRTGNLAFGEAMRQAYIAQYTQTEHATTKASPAMLKLAETTRQLNVGLNELGKLWAAETKEQEKAEKAADKAAATRAKHAEAAKKQVEAQILDSVKMQTALTRSMDAIDKRGEQALQAEIARNKKALDAEQKKWRDEAAAADNYFRRVIESSARTSLSEVEQAERTLQEVIARRNAMLANAEATNQQIANSNAAVAAAQKTVDEASMNDKIQKFEMIAQAASSILKTLFGKSKAAAIAAAIIDAAVAIVKCFAQLGWWGFIPAAAIAVQTAKQIQTIKNQDAGFRQGTPGTALVDFGEGTPTTLHGEEAVVTRKQSESVAGMVHDAITSALRSKQAGGSGTKPSSPGAVYLDGQLVGRWLERRTKAGLLPALA